MDIINEFNKTQNRYKRNISNFSYFLSLIVFLLPIALVVALILNGYDLYNLLLIVFIITIIFEFVVINNHRESKKIYNQVKADIKKIKSWSGFQDFCNDWENEGKHIDLLGIYKIYKTKKYTLLFPMFIYENTKLNVTKVNDYVTEISVEDVFGNTQKLSLD
jgi:hypothetical protein